MQFLGYFKVKLYFLIILAVSLFLGCTTIGLFGDDAEKTCGGKWYSSVEQICENDILKEPCGNGHYNPETQFCSQQDNKIYEICGGYIYGYNTLDKKCENDILLSKCGNDFYNPAIQFCDENDIFDKCDGEKYDTSERKCKEGILLLKCGDDYYDLATQFCSNSMVYYKCKGMTYNINTYKCENDVLFSKCGDDYYDPATQFCSNSMVYYKCKGTTYNINTHKCENDILFSKCGDDYYDPITSTQFCFGDELYDKCGNKEYNPEKQFCDERDGNIYRKVTIGTQTWMGENLNFSADGTVGRCYDDATSNCTIYGRLYDFLNAASVCPTGWHLPSYEEWNTLESFVGDSAGTKLKANNNLWFSGEGSDDYGFAVLPGGWFEMYELQNSSVITRNRFLEIRRKASFWFNFNLVFLYSFSSSTDFILEYALFPQTLASVRCIKD
jgi:uncharacterized protein (TIGR02145 family)